MKKLFQIPGFSRLSILGLAFTAVLFTACSKNDDLPDTPTEAAGLMVYNLAPDKPAVGFTLSGNQLGNSPLGYTNYSGIYLNIYPGNRELRSFDFNNGSTIARTTDTYLDSNYYSAFLLGAAGQYRHVVVKDDYSQVTPVAGKAWVRYINAVADTVSRPNVTVAGTTEGAIFGSVSDFKQVTAGSVDAAIASGAFTANRTLTLEENKIYTILFVGQPGATDPALAVQVKFVGNGTATN
ncbi:MAG: DUF4397 domain-containing protein [Chitinophagaceae bacterium]|nr:MAG: DUF4397 domain-containing protein [Chitinophagaceae bacterium]